MALSRVAPDFTLDADELERKLGVGGDKLRGLIAQARSMAYPVGYYHFKPNRLPSRGTDRRHQEGLVFCLTTLGSGLDETVSASFDSKNSADGYVLDYLGSEILFCFSHAVNRHIAEDMGKIGLYLSAPCYPDGCVPAHQADLLGEMKKQGEIPVGINDHGVLIPRKSMLYTFRVSAYAMPQGGWQGCSVCDRAECLFRAPL